MKLALVSLLFGASLVSGTWERTMDRARHDVADASSRARMGARAGMDRARGSRDAHAPPSVREARRGDPQVKLVALRCIDAQEAFGDEVALSVGGRRVFTGEGLVAGSSVSLAALQPVGVDGLRLGLAELDGAFFGVSLDDGMGEDVPSGLQPGSYTTTFRGNGGVYELAFRVEPGDGDRAEGRRDDAGRGMAPPVGRDRLQDPGRQSRGGEASRQGRDDAGHRGGNGREAERPERSGGR